jgi:SpoIID/LytB domain protein
MKHLPLAALVAAVVALAVARADDLSGDDKLRLLYSHRFTFTRTGVPLVTVELMGGQTEVTLGSPAGTRVRPEGEEGARIEAGDRWTVVAKDAQPAKLRWWTVVARQADEAELRRWTERGYSPKTFETGIVFGVEGDVIDSRETFLGIAPEGSEAAAKRAAGELSKRWGVATFVHPELLERPRGLVVARDQKTGVTIENPSVLWFEPKRGPLVIENVLHGGGGSQLGAEKRDTRSYHGRIYVTVGADGKLSVVNAVTEDELLAGIVPSEIFADAHPQALAAQAVAARDELLAKIGTRHFTDPFVICATQHCQVYGGVETEDPRTTKAVAATRGEVLLRDGGGGLVPAYYSASCGGHGEHNDNIWGTPPDPSLRGHQDADPTLPRFRNGVAPEAVEDFLGASPEAFHCGRTRWAKGRFRWSVTVQAHELDKLIADEAPGLGTLTEIVPEVRGVSGRIRKLRLVGSKGSATLEGDLKIRRTLGGLRSSLFVVTPERAGGRVAAWRFQGAGFGHGVGMCQTGAIGMAEAGKSYREILRHYYPGSHVRKLY